MTPRRFVPRLDLLEPRETPATGLTPDQVHQAAAFAELFYTGTSAALEDQSFIRQVGNRAPTQTLAATIVAQAPALQDILLRYVVGLGEEKAAAAPVYGEFFDERIDFYLEKANFARLSNVQAQQVSGLIDRFNAADATRAAQSGTTGAGTTTTGTAGVNPFGINTGTANTLPTPGTTGGTTQTTTPPAGSSGTTTPGTTGSGTTFGNGPGAGSTTGSSSTGTTPTQTSGLSPGTPDSATP